jgi:hypothetical protein
VKGALSGSNESFGGGGLWVITDLHFKLHAKVEIGISQ